MRSIVVVFSIFFLALIVADERVVPKAVDEARAEVKKAAEEIKHAQELLEKGTKGPSILERATDKVKDLFSSEPAKPAEPEDASILQKLRQYFRPEPDMATQAKEYTKESAESLLQKIRGLFGVGENAAERARQAAASSDAGTKAGESAESVLEKLRRMFKEGERVTEASKPAAKGAASYVGEKSAEAAESLADKVKSALGFAKEGAASAEASLHESTLDKIKSMLGMSPPSTTERIKEGIKSGAESMAEKVKHGLGMEEDTLVDKVKRAMGLEPTVGEKIKSAMGMGEESTLDKVKHAVGIDTEPSMGDKVRHALGIDKEAPSIGTRIKNAMGIETEQPSIGDRVRHTLGLEKEEPSLGEKIKEGVKHAMGVDTTASLSDKATSALGISKPGVLDRLRSYFGVHQPTTAEKMKESFDTSIAQARRAIEDRIEALRKATTGSARQSAYDDLVKTLKSARDDLTSRADTIYEAMSHPVDTMKHAAQGVADKISGTEAEDTRGLLTRARDDMSARINSLYDTIAATSRSWADDFTALGERVKGAFGRGSSYLLQGSQYDNGITSFYVNDNGHEYLDITGQNVDPNKYDKLKALNNFRSQYSLHPYKEFPSNVTIQTHPIKRTHVLIKSTRVIDGNKFDYVYDDGEEYLDVYWAGEAPRVFSKDMQTRIIDSFRQTHGLIPSAASLPRVRATIAHKSEKKDEL